MDCSQSVGKWEAIEIGPAWESCSVSLADIFEDPRCWVYGHEVGKRLEATQPGTPCKLLQPLCDGHVIIVGDPDTTEKDIEAAYNKGWVKAWQCCFCCEILQDRQADRSIQRCPECPQDAVRVQHIRSVF